MNSPAVWLAALGDDGRCEGLETMRVTVLGPVGACADDGTPIRVPGVRPRMLLARLSLTAGESVPTGSLIDGLWSGDPPTEAVNALHALVYRLRKALGDAGAQRCGRPTWPCCAARRTGRRHGPNRHRAAYPRR
ncbi:hypothetical protein AB0H34_29990 [Saccharopolyspora shandongensis]|uniref:AfsR/SARP family transcriptional regulator n=1 Tax=Saccharopolyspora shandongensis TaxID=418495 RepID=UPI0033D30245